MMKVEEPCLEMSLQTSEAAGNLPNNNNNNRWLQVRAGIQLLVSRMVLLERLSTAWQCSPLWSVLMGFTCPFIVFTLTLTALSNKTLFVVQDNLLICVQVKDFPST